MDQLLESVKKIKERLPAGTQATSWHWFGFDRMGYYFTWKQDTSAFILPKNWEKELLTEMFPCGVCKELCNKYCSSCMKISYCGTEHQKMDWKNHKSICRRYPVKIEKLSLQYKEGIKCRHRLQTTKWILPGQVIFKERSIISGPCAKMRVEMNWESEAEDWIKPVCLSCYKELSGITPYACSKCQWPLCSPECEKETIHADFECKVFAEHNVKPEPIHEAINEEGKNIYSMITVLRAILLRTLDPSKWQQIIMNKSGYGFHYKVDWDPNPEAVSYAETYQNILVEFIQVTCGMSEISEEIIEKVSTVVQSNDRGNDVAENRHTYFCSSAPKTVSYLFHNLSYVFGTPFDAEVKCKLNPYDVEANCRLKQTQINKFEVEVEVIATRTIQRTECLLELWRQPKGFRERMDQNSDAKLFGILSTATDRLNPAETSEFVELFVTECLNATAIATGGLSSLQTNDLVGLLFTENENTKISTEPELNESTKKN